MKTWIVVFTLANVFQVFRLVGEEPSERVRRYASIIYDASNVDPSFVLKDRYGMFNPEIHPKVSNSYIHMYINTVMEKPDGMGIMMGERQ